MLEGASSARSISAVAVGLGLSLGVLGALAGPAAPAPLRRRTRTATLTAMERFRSAASSTRSRPIRAARARRARGTSALAGGVSGVGVTTGAEKVHLVFWGSQWGTQSTTSGYATFSGDSQGVAPDLQKFFKGLGTGGETWSGVMTQYCQGVSTGATSCPSSNTSHVAYPTGGALGGVWEDASSAAPGTASAHQLGQEAEKAATHFGNTTTASNRNDQYVIVSPHGTNPDSYETQGFCAWHDYTADSTLDGGGAVSGSLLAFTNLPYIPDAGASCGQGFVNRPSTLDGVTIVEGHEYAETITDQFPSAAGSTRAGRRTATNAPGSPRVRVRRRTSS
jgi:hypothetical protein